MKKLGLALALSIGMAGAAAADPIHGMWQTIPDDNGNFGHIEISACGAKICGVLVRSFDSSGAPTTTENTGRQLIWDMDNVGDGNYDNGKVYSPDRDKTYNGDMQLNGNSLNVRGCVFGICRSGGRWSRVN